MNTRLNIPPINMNDGPQGFRDNRHPATTTAWPSGLTMAATWDPEAMLAWGDGMGREFYDKGANVQGGKPLSGHLSPPYFEMVNSLMII